MVAPYPTATIANWFLDRAAKDGASLTPMKLQKIIYFAHGWYLALTGNPLINEPIEAWNYGPVVPSIYHEFKGFGRNAIIGRATITAWPDVSEDGAIDLGEVSFVTPPPVDDAQTLNFLDRIWTVYGKMTAIQLANMSHVPDGAWEKAFREAKGKRSVDIPDPLIKEEFDAKRARARAA